MTRTISKFALATLFAALTVGVAAQTTAGETNTNKKADKKHETGGASEAAKEGKGARAPFHGTIASVDKAAKTITVGERTFHVTSSTKIAKAGKPATLEDATAGEEVGGQYQKADDGRMELLSLRIGQKPEKEPKSDKKKGEKPADAGN